MAETIRVAVSGAAGKMGVEICRAVVADPDLELVGLIDVVRPAGSTLFWSADPAEVFRETSPRVVIDFSIASAAGPLARAALAAGVSPVIGTSGLAPDLVAEIEAEANRSKIGAAVVPNFALGAVLMMHFSKIGARYFDYAEVVELHHETKIDAPSGTAVATARAMAEARGTAFRHNTPEKETLPNGRGAELDGIGIHSLRVPGLVSQQQVIFGSPGETLTITHVSSSRDSFMPGIRLAAKEIVRHEGFVLGLGPLLGLE